MSATQNANPLFNSNRFKLGTFGTNGKGTTITTSPDAFRPSWKATLEVAKIVDAAGFEAMLGYARWKGYDKVPLDHPNGVVLDPFTWAAGIAQATSYSAIIPTTHAPTIHPIQAAKQCATIDHISGGRMALNVVGGWNKPEFDMFGQPLADHETRYDYLEEWLQVLEKLWSATEEFDHEGRFLKLKGAMSMPQPLQKPRPAIVNAGGSGRGQRFAAQYADVCFVGILADITAAKDTINEYKKIAREEFGRETMVWTMGTIVQGATRQAAEDYLNYFAIEHADQPTIDAWIRQQGGRADHAKTTMSQIQLAAGMGSKLIYGDAKDIADGIEQLTELGIDGGLFGWNSFTKGLPPFIEEVIPMLEERGLREPFRPAVATTAPAPSEPAVLAVS